VFGQPLNNYLCTYTLFYFKVSIKPLKYVMYSRGFSGCPRIVFCIAVTAKLWIQDMEYDQYRPATLSKNKLALIHVRLNSFWLNSSPVANDGLLGQIQASNSKTAVGIAATNKLWIQNMNYDQYRPTTLFKNKLTLIHVLPQSLWLNSLPAANDGLWGK
jgi:hypothetical protein